MPPSEDPYAPTSAGPLDPPTTFFGSFRHLGPGLVLSASVVGSGELISTTLLGAQAGFITLWVIIVSCLVKVTVQLEFGKHAISTGEPLMLAFDRLPGPRARGVSWSIWTWLILMLVKLVQGGGVIGGVGLILAVALPGSPVVWVPVVAISVALLVFRGHYRFLERTSLVMTGFFTLLTFASLAFLQFTPMAVTWDDITSGLTFQLPIAAVAIAIGTFGITGVGGDEIMFYNYWLLEKGYASHTGRPDKSAAWVKRARGWIRVMYIDALLSMVVYTTMTCAFFLLGAAILNAQGELPESGNLVASLSKMYTETLGPWAKWVFLIGAFFVLYSTLFSAVAGWSRVFSDAFARIGFFDFNNLKSRRRSIAVLAWVFPAFLSVLYFIFKAPALMIVVGGAITAVILLIVAFAAVHFRYRRLDPRLRPTRFYDA